MMIFVQGQKGEVRSDWVIGASPAECVLHLQGYANEASFHLLSCEGTPAIAANAANARPKQLDLPASPAYSSNLAPQLWNGAWESYEKAGIQCVFLACLSACLPGWLMQQCQAVRLCFYTRHAFPTLLLGDANADAGAVVCRCIACQNDFPPKTSTFDYEYERFPPVSVSLSMLEMYLNS